MLKSIFHKLSAVLLCMGVLGLTGCVSGGGTAAPTTVAASVSIALTDATSGTAVTSISSGKSAKVSATVRDTSGAVVAGTVVTFATTASLATMTPASGTALTDATGVAFIQIDAASLTAAGATTITATATIDGKAVSGSAGFSVLAASTGATGVTVTLTNPTTGAAVTSIRSGSPAKVSATVRDAAGAVVPNTVVAFATTATLATMTPTSGSALTDASGVAFIQIDPASLSAAGATIVSASATVNGAAISGSAAFSVVPTSVGVTGIVLTLTDPVSGAPVSSISPGSPAKVNATVRDASGAVAANAVVTFSTTATLATMTPTTGTALTNASGVATIQIDAASLSAAGATAVGATANVGGTALTGSLGFSVSAANAGLANMTVGANPLSPYATTSVSVTVTGVPATSPVTINFSSNCASSGKASLPASVQTANGVATATYTDKGCASTDTITASVAGLAVTKTTTLTVNSPGATSIQFVSATPATIVLKGTGGAGLVESSLVKFRVVDNNNLPVTSPVNVSFDLTTRSGGILLDGLSTPLTKQTDANGEASVTVQSGTAPTAVWVNASVSGTTLASQSNLLRISTGRPVQDRFSLGVKTFNIDALNIDGVTTTVSVIASDRLGNPVPDGTAINFISNGAQIQPSCQTINGTCGVTFTSANSRPTNGRVTVAAYTLGEESFTDWYGDNIYHGDGINGADPFNDLGDVFIDSNENGKWDLGEQYIGFSSANKTPCSTSSTNTCGDGQWGLAHVRKSGVIVLSGNQPFTSSPTTVTMAGTCSNIFTVVLKDVNGNPLPAGSKLSIPAGANSVTDSTTPTKLVATIVVAPDTVANTNSTAGTSHRIKVSVPACVTPVTGSFDLNVTSPAETSNITYSFTFTVN